MLQNIIKCRMTGAIQTSKPACLSGIHGTEVWQVGWRICIRVRSQAGVTHVKVECQLVHWVLFSYILFLNKFGVTIM